jgi:hypothetical protein
LKPAPRKLGKEEFIQEYDLPHKGENPPHFYKGTVPFDLLKKLFGNRYSDNGHDSYKWQNCTVEDVVARIKYLHPILYQHGDDEFPIHVKIRFAEGISREYEEGEGFVDWCAFGVEVNKRQRTLVEKHVLNDCPQ